MEKENEKALSAEEIRQKHLYKHGLSVTNPKQGVGERIHKSALGAMEEYASQQTAIKDKHIQELESQLSESQREVYQLNSVIAIQSKQIVDLQEQIDFPTKTTTIT